jgi:hypothetical protein
VQTKAVTKGHEVIVILPFVTAFVFSSTGAIYSYSYFTLAGLCEGIPFPVSTPQYFSTSTPFIKIRFRKKGWLAFPSSICNIILP